MVDLAMGWGRVCVLIDDGTVSCWGRSHEGGPDSAEPTAIAGLTAVMQIGIGNDHTCVLMKDETVRCWGDGADGKLGTGDTASRAVPTPVPGLSGISELAVGATHTCVLGKDGGVACWGKDEVGEVGDRVSGLLHFVGEPFLVPL